MVVLISSVGTKGKQTDGRLRFPFYIPEEITL